MKLPKGMFRRGKSFYTRIRLDRGDRWISLGKNFGKARDQLQRVRDGSGAVSQLTIADVVAQWLSSYVRTARNVAGQQLAATRSKRYLIPRLGKQLLVTIQTG